MAATPCYGAPPAGANLEMFCCNEDETPDLLHTIHHQHIHPAHPIPSLQLELQVLSCHKPLVYFLPSFQQRAEHSSPSISVFRSHIYVQLRLKVGHWPPSCSFRAKMINSCIQKATIHNFLTYILMV